MNIFKILIPKDNVQEITELESWTVHWEVRSGWGDDVHDYNKCFIKKQEADEFKKQLNESAKFIKCWINIELTHN